MSRIPVSVALAVDTIAYAPVFIAQAAGFFGDLPVEIGIIKPGCWKQFGPDKAIERLLREQVPPLATLCDPIHALLAAPSTNHKTQIQGLMIKKPFLWVFDSKGTQHLRDLILNKHLTRIVTQPKRMTADVLMRYCLIQSGLKESQISSLLENLDQPDTDARTIQDIQPNEAYVSTDLLHLYAASNGERSIIFDFARPDQNTEQELRDYPMTALVTVTPGSETTEDKDNIQRVQAALDLGLQLISSHPAHALRLLQTHYIMRERSRRQFSAPYLEPLPPIADALFEVVPPAFNKLRSMQIYPKAMFNRHLTTYVERAFRVYSAVYSSPGQDRSPGLDLKMFVAKSSRASRPMQVRVLLKEYTEMLAPDDIPDATKRRFAGMLQNLGQIQVSDYRVVEQPPGVWLCFEERDRTKLRNLIDGIHGRVAANREGRPLALGICGDPGCGKSELSSDILKFLEAQHSFSCKKYDIAGQPRTDIVSEIERTLEEEASQPRASAILIDEANKALRDGDFIYAHLKSWLDGIVTDANGKQQQLDVSRTVLLVAGTWESNAANTRLFLQNLPAHSSGPDVASRMPERAWIELPDSRDPFERMVRVASCVRRHDCAFIDKRLLLFLAFKFFATSRELFKEVERLAEVAKNGVMLLESLDQRETRMFQLTNRSLLEQLDGPPIHVV